MAPIELIHFDLYEINGMLTKGDKGYFITFIDDCTRFCYVYLLNTKEEALHYFKIVYKVKVENEFQEKITLSWANHRGQYFSNCWGYAS
jgi:hypothetical protein